MPFLQLGLIFTRFANIMWLLSKFPLFHLPWLAILLYGVTVSIFIHSGRLDSSKSMVRAFPEVVLVTTVMSIHTNVCRPTSFMVTPHSIVWPLTTVPHSIQSGTLLIFNNHSFPGSWPSLYCYHLFDFFYIVKDFR